MEILTLVGQKEDNYYQLGLRDREKAKEILNVITNLSSGANKFLKSAQGLASKFIFKKNIKNLQLIKAYSEGLGIFEHEFLSFLITPDLLSGLTAVIPQIPFFQFGCSSLMYQNEQNNISHLRIFDFPIGAAYTTNERLISYKFVGEQAYCGISTSGYPFPSITSFNQSGLTFSLHQKFGHVFNKNGVPIFEIMENLIVNTTSIEDIIKELKNLKSISTWGVYISSSKEKKGIAVNLLGETNTYEEFDILPSTFKYFNNQFLNKNINRDQIQPLNFSEYCQQREIDINKRLKKIETLNDEKILKKVSELKNFDDKITVITPSSVLCCIMNPEEEKIIYNAGTYPKIYDGEVGTLTNVLTKPKQIISHKNIKNELNKGKEFYQQIIESQLAWDKKDFHHAVHFSQMAEIQQGENQLIPRFFKNVILSMTTKDKSLLKICLKEFTEMKPKFEGVFKDYCKLFIFRLERICYSKYSPQYFENDYLVKIFEFEKNIPSLIFQKVTRDLTSPRFDLNDIIFLHPLSNNDSRITL